MCGSDRNSFDLFIKTHYFHFPIPEFFQKFVQMQANCMITVPFIRIFKEKLLKETIVSRIVSSYMCVCVFGGVSAIITIIIMIKKSREKKYKNIK